MKMKQKNNCVKQKLKKENKLKILGQINKETNFFFKGSAWTWILPTLERHV